MTVIMQRKQTLVNTDPQRRCYHGVNFSEALVWTDWRPLEDMKFLKPGADPEARLRFWRELNDYSVSVGGARCEFKLEEAAP